MVGKLTTKKIKLTLLVNQLCKTSKASYIYIHMRLLTLSICVSFYAF